MWDFFCTFGLRLLLFVLGRLSLRDSLPFRSQKSIGFFTSPKLRSHFRANYNH